MIVIPLLLGLIVLTGFNFVTAPEHRESYWVLMSRPLLGMWLILYVVDYVVVWGNMRGLWLVTITVGLMVGCLGLFAVQWDDKSNVLSFITTVLPRLDRKAFMPDALLAFNPNEIAGAMAWLCPLLFGLTWLPQRSRLDQLMRVMAGVACLALLGALFLGQSRFALAGVGVGMGLFGLFGLQGVRRLVVLGGIAMMIGLQGIIMTVSTDTTAINAATPNNGLSSRDISSLNTRLELWQRGVQMVVDYPLTGIGMSMFRKAIRTPDYQIPYFESINFTAPHAHNEFVQIGADLGVGGWLFFIAIYGLVARYLWRAWQDGNRQTQLTALAIAAGLLAHGIYGMGDAITLWDRYAFLWWWMLALGIACYVQTQIPEYNSKGS